MDSQGDDLQPPLLVVTTVFLQGRLSWHVPINNSSDSLIITCSVTSFLFKIIVLANKIHHASEIIIFFMSENES